MIKRNFFYCFWDTCWVLCVLTLRGRGMHACLAVILFAQQDKVLSSGWFLFCFQQNIQVYCAQCDNEIGTVERSIQIITRCYHDTIAQSKVSSQIIYLINIVIVWTALNAIEWISWSTPIDRVILCAISIGWMFRTTLLTSMVRFYHYDSLILIYR